MDRLVEDGFIAPSWLASTFDLSMDTDKAEVSFESSILALTIPKSIKIKPKRIKVKANSNIEGKR